MTLRLLAAAQHEIHEALTHYRAVSDRTADAFLAALRQAFDRIAERPDAWRALDASLRRIALRRYPYVVIYAVEPDAIVVVAIHHSRRRPPDWQRRLEANEP